MRYSIFRVPAVDDSEDNDGGEERVEEDVVLVCYATCTLLSPTIDEDRVTSLLPQCIGTGFY